MTRQDENKVVSLKRRRMIVLREYAIKEKVIYRKKDARALQQRKRGKSTKKKRKKKSKGRASKTD
jgi:hypothetical protein